MSIRVYRYGLLPPTECNELVRAQMSAAHRYRNTLTEIERGRRAAYRLVMSSYDDIAVLGEAASAARALEKDAASALRAERAETRARKASPEAQSRLREAREVTREAMRALAQRRAAQRADTVTLGRLDEINDLAAELQRSARAHCGVYWGSYLLVEDAAMAARKAPLYDGTEPSDPRYSRWTGDGQVGVQIQGGIGASALQQDTRLRIEAVDERAWHAAARGERRRLSRTTLRVRVGSQEREPIWAAWPMVMHRPLPEGALIKRATVSLRRRGPREEWSAEITVAIPEPHRSCGEGAVAIDLGWRLVGEEIRVATWEGTDGECGELRLSKRAIGGLRKPEELRSIRDERFNAARLELVAWLGGRETPAWFRSATTTLSQWRSPGRLAALALRWRSARFDDDEAGYAALEAWRYRDHHLWAWEVNQRTSGLRHRREVYRCFAADLAQRYGTVALEAFDLREVARKPVTGSEEDGRRQNETARGNRQLAAVSELRLNLIQAFAARGGAHGVVSAVDTSRTCSACGLVERFDAELIQKRCSCGVILDQDVNAATNILREWLSSAQESGAARSDENPSSPDQIQETRWVKARRMRAEKNQRKGTARKPGGNGSK